MTLTSLLEEYLETRPRISVDSRLVGDGDWFFALKGAKTDGALFINQAIEKGAKKIIEQDALFLLQNLAKEVQKRRKAKVIAVTGSVGKTTTKEMISQMLQTKFKVGKTSGNQNSQIGFPMSLLNDVNGDEDFLVLEMGMTHPGNIIQLAEIAPPFISVITKIALVHAQNFNGLEGIADAKGEILVHPNIHAAVINEEAKVYKGISERGTCKKIYFSKNEDYPTPNLPKHHYENFVAACKVFELCGGKREEIITHFTNVGKRFQLIEKNGIFFLNDSYNAAEISIIGALENMPEGKRKLAVLGEMRELGPYSEAAHTKVGEKTLETLDDIILVGEGTKPIQDLWEKHRLKPPIVKSYVEALDLIRLKAEEGDVVLVKGANSLNLWKICEEF